MNNEQLDVRRREHRERMRRVVENCGCDPMDAMVYLEYRDGGYDPHQAALLARIKDPSEWQNPLDLLKN